MSLLAGSNGCLQDGPLDEEIPELTRMFLEEIVVESPTDLTVAFLDGTEKHIRL